MRGELESYKKATKPQQNLLDKAPSDSFWSIDLPLASDPTLKDQYLNFRGGVRFGRIMEDVDSFAGNIAFKHCDDSDPETYSNTLVTACLDRLDLRKPITLGLQDYTLEGLVTWAGRTSLQIDVTLRKAGHGRGIPGVLEAVAGGRSGASGQGVEIHGSMVFVSVGPDGKGAPINRLVPRTAEEKELFRLGEAANAERRRGRETSLRTSSPSQQEVVILHRAMSVAPSSRRHAKLISSTQLQSVHLMQPQERNRAGKIFGGFLMREAYELAYATASAYAAFSGAALGSGCGAPTLLAVDDVTFSQPVSIGDVVSLEARVVYTGGNEVEDAAAALAAGAGADAGESCPSRLPALSQIRVDLGIIHLATGARSQTNEFHFTFFNRRPAGPPVACGQGHAATTTSAAPPPGGSIVSVPLAPVVPVTYQEGMQWLDGRRRMLATLSSAYRLGSYIAT